MIIGGLEANKNAFQDPLLCLQSKMGPKSYIVLHCIVFYDVNLTTLPLDRPIKTEFTNGFSMKMSLIKIFVGK